MYSVLVNNFQRTDSTPLQVIQVELVTNFARAHEPNSRRHEQQVHQARSPPTHEVTEEPRSHQKHLKAATRHGRKFGGYRSVARPLGRLPHVA